MSTDTQNADYDGPPLKVRKFDYNESQTEDTPLLLKDFVIEKVLNNSSNRKAVFLKGKFRNRTGNAVIIFEKIAFSNDQLDSEGYFSVNCELRKFFQNDVYGNYECFPSPAINPVKTTIIYPATDKHIAKYSVQKAHIILESAADYNKLTLPYITSNQFNLQWVYNILDGLSEKDRVLYDYKHETDGFILVPDLKWDGHVRDSLYLLAIVRRRDLKSIRDLDASHLSLLEQIRDRTKKAIKENYNISDSRLRIFLHYQPSFYHLHVHFTFLPHEATGIYTERAHLLDTVINNIKMMSDYYQKATLPMTICEKDNLFKVYEDAGLVEREKYMDTKP